MCDRDIEDGIVGIKKKNWNEIWRVGKVWAEPKAKMYKKLHRHLLLLILTEKVYFCFLVLLLLFYFGGVLFCLIEISCINQ